MKILNKPQMENPAPICPLLGTRDDPETAMAFPTRDNRCFHVSPPALLRLDHQNRYCLSAEHLQCPVFAEPPGNPLPRGLHAQQGKGSRSVGRGMRIGIAAAVLVALLLLGAWWILGREAVLSTTEPPIATALPVGSEISPEETLAATVTPPTATNVVPTATIRPPHDLEVPIGRFGLVIHRIQEGDSLELLAKKYRTTSLAIQTINYDLQVPLWAGDVIVIPWDMTDVHDLPAFETFMVTENGITIDQIAAQLTIDPETLISYNGGAQGEKFLLGEWLLVPHLK